MKTFAELEKRAARNTTLVWWVGLTFLGAAMNMAGLTLAYLSFPILANGNVVNGQNMFIMAILAFLIPPAYSYLASHSLPEKRYVSPAEIAILSVGYILLQTRWGIANQFFAAVFLVMVGLFDEAISKLLVGVGGSDTEHRTFQIDSSIEEVTAFLNQEDVRGALDLDERRKRHSDKLIIYRLSSSYRQYVVVAAKGPDKTLVHCEAYWVGRYVIGIDKTSKRIFEKNMNYLENALRTDGKFTLGPADFDANFPYYEEITRIILEPTESKFARLAKLPRQTIAILVGIVFLALSAYLSYPLTNQITQQSLSSAFIGLGSLFVGLLPFIRGPVSRKEWE